MRVFLVKEKVRQNTLYMSFYDFSELSFVLSPSATP